MKGKWKDLFVKMARAQESFIRNELARRNGNAAAVARSMGIPYTSLLYKMKTYGIDIDQYKPADDTLEEGETE